MSVQLTLVAHAATAATVRAAFPLSGEGLETRGVVAAQEARGRLRRVVRT
ncbi:MAG: hypothetical protein H0X35_12570, partial [Pseudonocardiales bacterium]|nr:hypothetical protein [Pseudonocardiales bacterium]